MPLELLVDWFPFTDDDHIIITASAPSPGAIAFGAGLDFRFITIATNGSGMPADIGPQYVAAWFTPTIGQYIWLSFQQALLDSNNSVTGLRGPPRLFRVRVLGP